MERPLRVNELTLMSDILVRQVFNDNTENAREVLRILLEKPELEVENCRVQEHLPGPKEIVMDIVARDTEGRIYDIEIQNTNSHDILNRASFYMCRMISNSMKKGVNDYNQMPICIVIFIMDTNPFGKMNIPYRVYSSLEGDEYFRGNESRIMIFNGEYEADDAISSLMKDLHQKDHDKIANDILRKSVVKYTKGGKHMVYNPLQENYEAGRIDAKEAVCLTFLKDGRYSEAELSKLLEMPLEDILKLKKKLKTSL